MTAKLKFLLLGMVLVLGLAACGNDKDDKPNDTSKENDTSAVTDESEVDAEVDADTEKEDESKDAEAGSNLKNDKTIGLSMDDFKVRFNENSTKNGQDYSIGDYEWYDLQTGSQTASVEIDDELTISGLVEGEEDQLKAILLEVEGIDSRKTAYDVIQTIIESVDQDMTEEDAKSIMEELGLDDPTKDGDDTEHFHDHNGFKYLLMNDRNNYIEFGIANQNDPDLELE